jgi:hypothetical protein
MSRKPMHPVVIFAAVIALLGALVAAWIAWITKVSTCEPDCHGGLLDVQLIVSLAGLAPAAILLFATSTGLRRLALLALVAAVMAYGAWGLLNNLAVHGSLFGG